MTVSKIVHLADPPLTNQQLADMALTEWQSARSAAQRGEIELARGYRREALAILEKLK